MRSPASWTLPLLAAALGSCGWHAGLLAPPGGAETVGVEIFGLADEVLERDLEPLLHDQMTRSVSDIVDARLVPPGRAELVISGRILRYSRRGGIPGPKNELLETALRISLEASLVRRATGEVLRTATAAVLTGYVTADRERTVTFIPGGDPLIEDTYRVGGLEGETDARERILRHLADQLVLDLFGLRDRVP